MVYALMNKGLNRYKQVLRIRLIEEAIADAYTDQLMRCPTHLSIGQELLPVVISESLNSNDKVYSGHRAHAHYLAKGGSLKKLIAELYGKRSGCTAGIGGSMHLSDLDCGFVASTAIVANSIPLAVGNALVQQLDKGSNISVSYFGDGATEEGAFYESINFAALKKLPILFVCENNFYSVYSPLSVRQPIDRDVCALVEAMGVPSMSMDGNQIDLNNEVINDIISDLKQGNGPFFIEAKTYRHREHCGPNFDDHLEYRKTSEVELWMKKDPLRLLEKSLQITTSFKSELMDDIKQEICEAFRFARDDDYASEIRLRALVYDK